MFVLLKLKPLNGNGEFSIGRTAGSGIEGAGDWDRLIEVDDPKEDRRLCVMADGGFIGRRDVGVPGIEGAGAGELGGSAAFSSTVGGRPAIVSGGAGLFAAILLLGMSIFVTLLCCLSVNSPSLLRRFHICIDLSEDCVATYSLRGSQATP
jgi:hypothetical protein